MSGPLPRSSRRVALAGGTLALAAAALALPHAADRASSLFFKPNDLVAERTPEAAGLVYEVLAIPAEDGSSLDAWRFAAEPDAARPRGVLVVAHGNYGNLTHQWRLASELRHSGLEVLLFDYRGFGRSEGEATRRHAVADVRAVLAWAAGRAVERGGVPVLLLGQSMGGALAVEAAATEAGVTALALDSPFASWPGVAWHHFGRGRWHSPLTRAGLGLLFAGAPADPVALAPRLADRPVLVIAGSRDEVCPPEHAMALADASGARLVVIEGAAHVGSRNEEEDAAVLRELSAFFTDAAAR